MSSKYFLIGFGFMCCLSCCMYLLANLVCNVTVMVLCFVLFKILIICFGKWCSSVARKLCDNADSTENAVHGSMMLLPYYDIYLIIILLKLLYVNLFLITLCRFIYYKFNLFNNICVIKQLYVTNNILIFTILSTLAIKLYNIYFIYHDFFIFNICNVNNIISYTKYNSLVLFITIHTIFILLLHIISHFYNILFYVNV